MVSKRYLVSIGCILISAPSFAAPVIGRSHFNPGLRLETQLRNSGDTDQAKERSFLARSKFSLERLDRQNKETVILDRLRISRNQMTAILDEFQENSKDAASLQKIIKDVARNTKVRKNRFDDQILVREYFQFLSETQGEFHLSPTVMKNGIKKWSPKMKKNLVELLDAASYLASREAYLTREEAFQEVVRVQRIKLLEEAFNGSFDDFTTLSIMTQASVDELRALYTQSAIVLYNTIGEGFEIYDRAELAAKNSTVIFTEGAELRRKTQNEVHEMKLQGVAVKTEVDAILAEGSSLSGKTMSEMRDLYRLVTVTTDSEARAILAEAAAISGKAMEEVQVLYRGTSAWMAQLQGMLDQASAKAKAALDELKSEN